MIKFLDLKSINDRFQPELSSRIREVMDSGWYILGKEVKEFEEKYSYFIGTQYCIGVANGLDALRLIFRAYLLLGELEEGDEVIVPANTYIASILAITDNRLKPVLVEPDINTYNIDPYEIEKHITDRTRAIMIVHLYGQNSMHPEIKNLSLKYNLKLIEDNAQAQGCFYSDNNISLRTGSIGHASGHSFYPGKNLGCLGDGGAVTTDNAVLADLIRSLSNYGSGKKYVFDFQGVNSRLDELQAAVLCVKLKYLDSDNEKRRIVARNYLENIRHPDILLPQVKDWNSHVFHLFPIRTTRREELQQYLWDNQIQTLIHYPIPPHKQKCYLNWNNLSYPITEKIHSEELSLPISPVLTPIEIQKVVETLNSFK